MSSKRRTIRRSSTLSESLSTSQKLLHTATYEHLDFNTNVPEGLTFYPTEKEFANPIEYVKSIAPIAQPYGICKIVPPEECALSTSLANLTSALTEKQFMFTTKVQGIDQLQFRNNRKRTETKRTAEDTSPHAKRMKFNHESTPVKKETNIEEEKEFGFERNESEIPLRSFKRMADQFKQDFFAKLVDSYKDPNQKVIVQEAIIREVEEDESPNKPKSRRRIRLSNSNTSSPNVTPTTTPTKKEERIKVEHDLPTLENNPLPRPVLLKLARKGGVKRVRGTAYYDTVNGITKDDIESEYWNTVDNFDNSVQRTVTVQYGSDLDCTQVGSCFPKTYPYGWNMNKLAILDDSVLKYLYQTIPGITSPMLYVGMLFSSFCWHVEDNFLCAINYIHSGANKTWYAIPGSAAQAFEKVMRDTLPDLFENQPNLLQMLITMLSPRVLQQHNVPIYRMQHEAGSFIITYPRAYHAGFNHGFNIAESVNFSPGTWLPYGRICINKYHHTHRPTAFAHDQIICTAAIRDNISQFTADVHAIIIAELELIIKLEEKLRKYVEDVVGITRKEAMPDSKKHPHRSRKVSVQKDNKICLNCKQDCYLSGIMIDQSVMQIPSPNAQSKKRTSSMMMGMKAMQCDENEPSEPFVCLKCVETYIQNKDISVKNCALVERYTIAQLRELHKDATETKPKKYKESKTKKRKSQDNMVDE